MMRSGLFRLTFKENKKGKGKKKSEKEQELAKVEDVLKKMCKQGDALVAAVERMEENSRIQTNAIQEMSKSISVCFFPDMKLKDRGLFLEQA